MVRADLLPFPSFSSAAMTGGVTRAAMGAGAQSYNPLAQEVARDVQQFIAQGGGPLAALNSPQAQWMAAQASRQLQQAEKKTEEVAQPAPAKAASGSKLQPEQQAFLDSIAPWAQQAAQRLGISVRSVMAHAALESGWGQRPLRDAQGADTFNLFGLKAAGGWRGARTAALTTEFEDGQAVAQVEEFRQYNGLDETFADYVRLLEHSPRYRQALHTGNDVQAFARALAAGGYATDPQYAQKLMRVSQEIPAQP